MSMANAVGLIQEAIWRDSDYRTLSRRAQAMYVQLLSQKELDCAGVLPLQPEKWATGCDEMTVDMVWEDLAELQQARFVFYDTGTYEALVRTHVRNSNVMKVPNMRKSARRSAALLASESLRVILAAELRATGDTEMAAMADHINPCGTLAEPFANPSKSEPLRNPSLRVTEPTGKGKGKGTGVTVSRTKVGEQPPPPQCTSHVDNPDKPCRACKRYREWETAQAERDQLEHRRRLREARENCPRCHGTNTIEVADGGVIKCDHAAEVTHA